MSFNFDGMVLRGATTGGTNAQSTALATSGVLRDVKESDPNSSLSSENPSEIDLNAEQYRASVLYSPNQTTTEYVIWASNTGKISTIVGDENNGDDPYLKRGNCTLTFSSDGRTIIIFNDDNNSIDSIFGVVITNTTAEQTYLLTKSANPSVDLGTYNASALVADAFDPSDLESGILRVKQSVLDTYFDGAFTDERDRFVDVAYFLAPIKFFWSRNDNYQTRFFFDYRLQSWRLIKGTATLSVGVVNLGTKYKITPKPNNLTIGSYLQGDSQNTDRYSMLRVGRLPNSGSLPLAENPTGDFNGVLVVADSDVSLEFDFSAFSPQPYAIIGENSAELIFNPLFVVEKAGQALWYSYLDFVADSSGLVGGLENADFTPLFISPIPKAFERPFIKVGNRRYLSPILVDTDSELGALSLSSEREVGISLSTGQLKFHSDLIEKAQKDSLLFDPNYLGALVYYDGVGLNLQPQGLRLPTPLVDNTNTPVSITQANNGKVYLPLADPYANNGLGASGVLHQPDGSGVPFNLSVTTDGQPKIGVRQGGDSESDTASGVTREIIPRTLGMPDLLALGDTFLFTSGASITVREVDKIETENLREMSKFDFSIKGSVAEITREGVVPLPTGFGSAVKVSAQSRKNLGRDELVYFVQSIFTPSIYTNKARLITKIKGTFTFTIGDVLVFAVDGTPYKWVASAAEYNPTELITDLYDNAEKISNGNNDLSSTSLVISDHYGYLIFDCDQEIEIGFGLNGVRNLSGSANIGLVCGWRAIANQDNWLSDSGMSFGLERSPLNKDGTADTPDFYALYRLNDQRISPSDGLSASSVLFLDYAPLEDIAGYDENVFFKMTTFKKVDGSEIPVFNYLKNYEQVVYQFGERYILFIEDMIMDKSVKVENTQSTLLLGATQMIPQTFLGVEPNPTFGLFVSESGTALERKELNSDFLLDSTSGLGTLIDKYGELKGFDFQGTWSIGDTFSNQFANGADTFIDLGVNDGDKLKILSGESQGWYIISEIIDGTTIRVEPPFLSDNGNYPMAWEIYSGIPRDQYDPSLVADISFSPFSHIVNEPLHIRLLSWVGKVSSSSVFALDLGESLTKDHIISLRFEASGDAISLYRLVVKTLGTIANQSLFIELSDRVSLGHYTISIDTEDFSPIPVSDSLWDSYAFGLEDVYLNEDTGELRFGDRLLSDFSSADVTYKDNFLPSNLIPSGSAEFNAFNGECVISETDRLANQDKSLYFVQELNTSGELDVACNALSGTVFFLNPLKDRRIVELQYFLADDLGEKLLDEDTNEPIEITEFLPLYIRSERAEFIEPNKFSFNLAEDDGFQRTVYSQIPPRVVVDGFQCNYGVEDCVVEDNVIYLSLSADIGSESVVTISYAVLETLGGEQVYNSSRRPMYRPSFYLEEEQDTFTLETDRTSDIQVGMLFRLGADNFYIKSVQYDSATDETTVSIFPSPIREMGSRSPNNDILTLLSSEPIAHSVDPNDPQSTISKLGFLLPLSDPLFGTEEIAWKAVNRGQNKIEFLADLTKYAIAGHILEIGGTPFTISQSNLSDDGLKTIIELISVFPQGYAMGTDEVKLSIRPIYPPFSQAFLGGGGFVETEPYSLILFGEKDENGNEKQGRELVNGVHYNIDPANGNLALLEPLQAPLFPNQVLYFNHTRIRELKPYYDPKSQTLIKPKYYVSAKVVSTPSAENEMLGALIQTKNTFYSPDTFYCRAVPLLAYSGETVQRLSSFASSNPQGPVSSVSDDPQSFDKGRASLETQRSNLTDDDRSAKLYLEFYNVAVNAFEQVNETITGNVIGDRDGKFRFFIGRGKEDAPKGYECPITGVLNPINIWALVFESESGFALDVRDDLVDPRSASLLSAEVSGDTLDQDAFEMLSARQKKMVKNDIDDVLLVNRGRWRFQWFEITRKGVYQNLSLPSNYSRLFPEQAKTFLLTYPGIQFDLTKRATATTREEWSGWYSFSRIIEPPSFSWEKGIQLPKTASTRNTEIGVISNPVLGKIDNIQDVILGRRFPRARIYAYYADGVEQDAFGTGFPSVAIEKPCILATPLHLSEFPIDPTTGLPNLADLVANGGDLNDLSTGDPNLRTPAFTDFELAKQVAFGYPNGTTVRPSYSEEEESGVFVDEVLYGCLITLSGGIDVSALTEISSYDQIVQVDGEGEIVAVISLERGDTIYLVPALNSLDLDSISDPPTQDELKDLSKLDNSYDVFVDRKSGTLLDKTFLNHTKDGDKWFSGPWFGQKPPLPMSELEGQVSFVYNDVSFLEIPALKGEDKDDNGDYSIPYLKTKATERDRFGEITRITSEMISLISPNGYYVYADEIRDDSGFIVTELSGTIPPCALVTTQRHNPHSFLNSVVGKNDTEPFDLLLVEYLSNATLPNASQGILSVGRVSRDQTETLDGNGGGTVSEYSVIEPPRFISPTGKGSAHRYDLYNAMVHIHDPTEWDWSNGAPPNGIYNDTNTSGVVIHEDNDPTNPKIVLDFSSLGQIELADGTGNGTGSANPADPLTWGGRGGFNRLFGGTAKNKNTIDIAIFARERTTSSILTRDAHAGDILLRIRISNNGQQVYFTYTDETISATNLTSTTFGVYDPLQQSGSTDDFKCITLDMLTPNILDLPTHAEIPTSLNGTVSTTRYAFDFAITVMAKDAQGEGSFTAQIEQDRLTFSECYDLRYARERQFRHPVGKQVLRTTLSFASVDTKDFDGNDQTMVITDSVPSIPNTFSFLERDSQHLDPVPDITDTHFGIGTFTSATAHSERDEKGTLRVMAFEGFSEYVDLLANPPTVTVLVEDIDDTGDGIVDRFGVITQITVTDIGGATGLQGEIFIFITDTTGYGAQAIAEIDSNGDLILGDLTILNGGRDYSATPVISFIHNPYDVPVRAEDITFSLVPSSIEDKNGVIGVGSALLDHKSDNTILINPQLSQGALNKVEKGDVVVVPGSAETSTFTFGSGVATYNLPTNACGTYLVRSALENNLTGTGHLSVDLGGTAYPVRLKAKLPSPTSWLQISFPNVIEINTSTNRVKIDEDVTYADSPSGNYFGRLGVISYLEITSGGTQFDENDIGERFTIGSDCVVEIVGVDQDPASPTFQQVTELAIINRGSGFATDPTWSVFSVNGGLACTGKAYRVTEKRIFFILNKDSANTIAISCPFSSIIVDSGENTSTIFLDISTIGTASSKVFYGDTVLDNSASVTITLPNGSSATVNNADFEDFFWEYVQGSKVGGHKYIPINLRKDSETDRYVGKRYVRDTTGVLHHISSYGFLALTLSTQDESAQYDYVSQYVKGSGAKTKIVSERFEQNQIGIVSKEKTDSVSFLADKDEIIYDNTPTMLDLQSIDDDPTNPALPFSELHNQANCLVSGDFVDITSLDYGAVGSGFTTDLSLDFTNNEGFLAQDGIYTEPSFPKSAQNLVNGNQRVVEDTAPSVDHSEIGYRKADYDEKVLFQVKRIRRFHEIQSSLQGSVHPLRYAYEIRRGIPTDYSTNNKGLGVLSASGFTFDIDHPSFENPMKVYDGTQLGAFNDEDVNIESGDMVRLLFNGELVETAEILRLGEKVGGSISSKSTKLSLKAPGFIDANFLSAVSSGVFTGWSFEIYLRNAIIPHEQSNEELLALITERTIMTTKADYANQLGGYVPNIPLLSQTTDGLGEISPDTGNPKTWSEYANKLYDDLNAPNMNDFLLQGVQVGDIVIVDSSGTLQGATGYADTVEKGARPFGDFGIEERDDNGANSVVGRNAYEIGGTSPLDDNRGFYTVVEIKEDHLVLKSGVVNAYVGEYDNNVTFPEDVSLKSTLGYTIYPTVHNSTLHNGNFFVDNDDQEGQMDLRPTQYAGYRNDGTLHPDSDKHNSFAVNDFSIRPFSYRIIRPSNLFSEETIEFVLMLRERMLSLIEHLKSFMVVQKSGTYYDFQDNQHIEDIGTPTIAETGLGVYHNAYLEDILGRMDLSPFGNDSDCLSLLDRRFIIQDGELDTLCPDSTGFGSGLVSSLGGVPYTAFDDVDGFYSGISGSLVRPLLLDHIEIILNDRDRFRDLRSTWIEYRTHRTNGILAQIRQFDSKILERILDQEAYFLRLKTQK